MRFVLFYHSLISDWNHGNAHFLRGVATELIERRHDVAIYEPANAWSVQSLIEEHGEGAIFAFGRAYPTLKSTRYNLEELDLPSVLEGVDVVIVHEWSDPALVARIGQVRRELRGFTLLFHDTHHRALTSREEMAHYDLRYYDGVLAYGEVLRELYLREGWVQQAWTWHEAADTRVFRPHPEIEKTGDLIWIGNWGDDERSAELQEFLIEPAKFLRLRARIHGVRYPQKARDALAEAKIEYAGWIPNFEAPEAFASFKFTVHVPRRPYVQALRGIPTIRPFEALACGIPMISAPWEDVEHLFRPETDFLTAKDGAEMKQQMERLLNEPSLAEEISTNGLETIKARHTCSHRVDELLEIVSRGENG